VAVSRLGHRGRPGLVLRPVTVARARQDSPLNGAMRTSAPTPKYG
jgi:hypothetical protein